MSLTYLVTVPDQLTPSTLLHRSTNIGPNLPASIAALRDEVPRRASYIVIQCSNKLHLPSVPQPEVTNGQSVAIPTINLRHSLTKILDILRLDLGAGTHDEGAGEDGAVRAAVEVAVVLAGAAILEDLVGEAAGVELLAGLGEEGAGGGLEGEVAELEVVGFEDIVEVVGHVAILIAFEEAFVAWMLVWW